MSNKEEEITRKIELLKRKNELLLQRHKEVEEDKKSAEKTGQSYSKSPNAAPHEKYPREHRRKDKNSGRFQSHRAHMDDFDEKYEENDPEQSQPANNKRYIGRGARRENTNRGTTTRGRGRGRGRQNQDYEATRRENFRLMEEEFAQGAAEETEDSQSPGVSKFLDDPRRKGELDPEHRWKSTRHKGNYGGLDFENIKHDIRGRGRGGNYRQPRGRGRGNVSRLQMSAEYTGRERQDQERWHAMREAADKEIRARSKTSEGQWRREWDSQKEDNFNSRGNNEPGYSDKYDEPRRNHRGGGRGRRGSGRGRRGSRSSHESGDNGKNTRKPENETPAQGEQVEQNKETKNETSTEDKQNENEDNTPQNMNEEKSPDSKPQRNRKSKNKSPRHLAQQRAQTPSSKDGTEVWAQNSHHSDETGQEWKNGANRSAEQWLPSDEGNRNPAIDERKLEQQEDGATVYSRHLGRGWGTEKNIKATKAWVVDTEKAGATEMPPSEKSPNSRGRDENRFNDKPNSGRKGRKYNKEDARLKEIANERSEMRSASPRLRRGHPELTVQINENGGRRVKRYSEGDKAHSHSEKISTDNDENKDTDNKGADESINSIKSPQSAGALKTPEGVEYVTDWATEMDLQSPTYATRHKKLNETEVPDQTEILKPSASETTKDISEVSVTDTPVASESATEMVASERTEILKPSATQGAKDISEVSVTNTPNESEPATNTAAQDLINNMESETCMDENKPGRQRIVEGNINKNIEHDPTKNQSNNNAPDKESDDNDRVVEDETDIEEQRNIDSNLNISTKNESSNDTRDEESKSNDTVSIVEKSPSDRESKEVGERSNSAKESTDGNFKDAEEDVEDEFYECDEDGQDSVREDLPLDNEQASKPKEESSSDVHEKTKENEDKLSNLSAVTISENVLSVVEEIIQQEAMTPATENTEQQAHDSEKAEVEAT